MRASAIAGPPRSPGYHAATSASREANVVGSIQIDEPCISTAISGAPDFMTDLTAAAS